jgi:hypothetical protein
MMLKLASTLIVATGYLSLTVPDHWTATLRSMVQNGPTGSAQVESAGTDSMKVSIAIDNAPSGVLLHWYVSAGGCDGAGNIVGKESAYPALRTVEGGTKAEVSATVRAWPNPSEQYAIQVIAPVPAPSLKADPKTAAAKTRVIACGDLVPAGVTPAN